ncbi:MAG TPA: 1,4-alpha-glucan branching protein domain-containing protein [Anaerolineales bacterium]|nr:1,4-alpha-glucan branching protein domain-containing protein [Anaerolineales bacterium]
MPKAGAFTFVLHSHLPYTRQAGRWPHGEEWIHEAIAETYIPLLDMLHRLRADSVSAHLTLGLTPVLLEQLADADVQRNFISYVEERIRAADADLARWQAAGDLHLASLADFYAKRYRATLEAFRGRYAQNLPSAFARLQADGLIETMTCAATHGYLPLLEQDGSIRLQLRTGVETHRRHFGTAPKAIWLPECAYRPAYRTAEGRERPGLESFLARDGLSVFFAETHMIEGGRPVGIAAGEAIGPYGAILRRYSVPIAGGFVAAGSTFEPYYVTEPKVAVLGRENRTGLQVWSAEWGYPGDFDYREFHKKDGVSGLQYWRITGARVDLGEKDTYHPDWAQGRVLQHADHFAGLVHELLERHYQEAGKVGIICASYDTELFGHWWFEGIDWLEAVLRRLAASASVDVTTASRFVEEHPPQTVIHLPEGSWGAGGTHFVWDNADTHWMWPLIHDAEGRFASVVERFENADERTTIVLNQAARELLLLQSSDWPFLVTTGQAKDYAVERFRSHLERFNELVSGVEAGRPDTDLAGRLWERDKVFPDIDFRWFRA